MPHKTQFILQLLVTAVLGGFLSAGALAADSNGESDFGQDDEIVLRAWGVPSGVATDIGSRVGAAIMRQFRERFPNVNPVATTGLTMPGGRTMDIVPLMQIAGDIAPDVMYVNFRQSDTYIRSKFLYPLDRYVERLEQTEQGKKELRQRVPQQCWDVIRRACPYREECPYLRDWGEPTIEADHKHIWSFPVGPLVMGIFYRKDLFADAGLPHRPPRDWVELIEWSRRLTDPRRDQFGLKVSNSNLSWTWLNFLYSAGGRAVEPDPKTGRWEAVFDSDEAVEAAHFLARLRLERIQVGDRSYRGVVNTDDQTQEDRVGMSFNYLDSRFFSQNDPNLYGFGPVPRGPSGLRGSEFNSMMCGIFAGLSGEKNKEKRDAAWEYIRFYDGWEARRIRTDIYIQSGNAKFVNPELLRAFGYTEFVRLIPPGWEEAYQDALKNGVPEPYGRNCQLVYKQMDRPLGQILQDSEVIAAIDSGDKEAAKKRIKQILQEGVAVCNERMLGILDPEEAQRRQWVALAAAVAIFVGFAFLFHRVFKVFKPPDRQERGWAFGRYKWAYSMMFPGVSAIALWAYYPLYRGMIIAFLDYNVRGFSEWVGLENFATVLYDDQFWYSMYISLWYAGLFMLFGFGAPIILAFLLTEVPRGKILFRTIYYLPTVLTGVVVIFLWKNFYGSGGLINQIVNVGIGGANFFLESASMETIEKVSVDWLNNKRFALFFCLLPTIWAGMGPGCLIYLAALKTVPEDLYEAADIDGAGICQKTAHIAIPSIRVLIVINFIGAFVGSVKGASSFVLAMTGGGPYTPHGQTEVVGLRIFYEAFMYLRFGQATAMAWVLGAFLIGFTVLQLQRLSRVEFRAAGQTG
jgi:multiple sugar transport system permease protein